MGLGSEYRELKERYEKILNATRGLLLISTVKEGRYIEVNENFAALSGYAKSEIIGRTSMELGFWVDPKEREKLIKSLMLEGRVEGLELTVRNRAGQIKTISVSGELFEHQGEPCLVLFGYDITEQLKMEEKLKEVNRRLNDIVDFLPDPTFVVDKDRRVIAWNRAMEAMTGVKKEEIIGQGDYAYSVPFYGKPVPTLIDLVDRSDPEVEERYDTFVRFGHTCYGASYCPYVYGGKGAYLWAKASPLLDGEGRMVGAIESVRDVTDNIFLEKAWAAEKEQLAATLRSIGDGVITTDSQGRVILINRAAEEMLGVAQEEAKGKALTEVFKVRACDNPEFKEVLEKVLTADKVVELPDMILNGEEEGEKRIVSVSGSPIKDPDGQPTGCVIAFRDVTERKRREEEIIRKAKLESLGVLAGGIAHDFNNLLTVIMGNLSVLKALNPSSEYESICEGAEKACSRAKALANRLLTFARGGWPVKKVQNLGDFLEDAVQFATSGSEVRCETIIPRKLWAVEIDGDQIAQVIQNLIINAIQAMPNGGTVRLKAENVWLDKKNGVPLPPGPYVKVTVQDQGTGIPKEHLARVFDPYFTTKETGSGLGLTSAYSIIKAHGGYLGVESELGTGSNFYFYLPARPDAEVEREERKKVALSGKGRILVMDDEEGVRQVVAQMLEAIGYEAVTARDGKEAVELYERALREGKRFRAVLIDLTVPGGMGGRETMARLLKIDPQVKGIISSGYSNDPIMAKHREYGFSGVISKPYGIKELSRVLNEVLAVG